MSTSSTTCNDYKRNKQVHTSEEDSFMNPAYGEIFRSRRGINEDVPLRKRSNEKVLDELSTFIAEFSYLTDGQESKPGTPKHPIRSYNAYLVQSSENNENVFNEKHKKKLYRENYPQRRKSVEWIDQVQRIPEQRRRNSLQRDRETPLETSDMGRPHISRKPRDTDYIFEQLQKRLPNQRFKARKFEDGNAYMRPRSKFKRKDDHKLIRFRIESDEQNKIRKPQYQKITRKRSKSQVRYWPLRYEGKKRKYRVVKVPDRKEKVIPYKRKEEITSDSPTVITLYPKNAERKQSLGQISDLEFLTDPDLPCKCFKCMKKYEQLHQISNDEPNTLYYKPKNEFQSISVGDNAVPHQKTHFKEPVKCQCKKIQSSHTILHPKNSIQNHSFRPQVQQNNCCCNLKQRNNARFHGSVCPFPHNLVPHLMPPTNQLCLPKQITEHCCRPYQFYEPYSNLRCQKLVPCSYPCDDEHCTSHWNLNEIGSCDEKIRESRYKSVYFRFDCVGHQINPTITQYFHSILNNKIQ